MKKGIIATILLLSLSLSLFACNTQENTDDSTETPTDDVVTAPEIDGLEENIIKDGNRNIYEIYVESFTESGDIAGISKKLDHIKGLGYDTVLLSPLHTEELCYIKESLGDADDVISLTDAAHAKGLDVIVSIDPHENDHFLSGDIDIVLAYWINECHVDGLNFMYAAGYALNDAENIAFLESINSAARAKNEDIYLMAELSVNDDAVISSYFESGFDSFKIFTYADATGSIAGCLKIHNGEALGDLFLEHQKNYSSKITTTYISDRSTNNRPATYMSGIENIKMLAGIQMLMNGSISTFYGDEIGMISRGGDKTNPMYWTAESGNAEDYLYASADKQLNDKNSIYTFYAAMLNLRNCLPSIARGEVEVIELENNRSVCIIQKTYNDETVTIAINLALPEDPTDITTGAREVEIKKADFGYDKVVGAVCAYGESYEILYDEKSETFAMPPYSILILK